MMGEDRTKGHPWYVEECSRHGARLDSVDSMDEFIRRGVQAQWAFIDRIRGEVTTRLLSQIPETNLAAEHVGDVQFHDRQDAIRMQEERDDAIRAKAEADSRRKFEELAEQYEAEKKAHLKLRTMVNDAYAGVWYWLGDGTDDLNSMSDETVVTIQAEDLRKELREAEVAAQRTISLCRKRIDHLQALLGLEVK